MSYTENTPLTVAEAVTVAALVSACQRNARVGWVGVSGDVLAGTMRSVGTEHGCADFRSDVRACFLHVTTDRGFEEFWPVPWACERYDETTLVLDYQVIPAATAGR